MPTARRLATLRVGLLAATIATAASAQRPHPILFVTQTPMPNDFTTIGSVFGNHLASVQSAPRGGDLWIVYPDNSTRNLTAEAGYGVASGFQGATSIAVREPAVHWSGTKAIFSMVIGSPPQQYQVQTYFWRLYEVTGLGQGQTATITLVPNQPMNANNVSPIYLSDGRILFSTDRPRNGAQHHYPQRDEYEEAPTVSGLWVLDPATGRLDLLDHAPSGDFKPTVDSFGRVIFTRWDHLQRDQQADADHQAQQSGQTPPYGTFNWSSERPGSVPLATRAEVFPEPRPSRTDILLPHEQGHTINHFFPWMMNQDGTGLETLNHVGRHELHTYFDRAFNDDPNLDEFICGENACGRTNPVDLFNFLQIREASTVAGRYYGIDAPEFYTHAAGQVLSLQAEPSRAADDIVATAVTHRATRSYDDTPEACHSGFYRNPLQLSNGALVVVHAGERQPGVPETRSAYNEGTRAAPVARYKFRLRSTQAAAAPCAPHLRYGATLTPGITKTLWFWDPDVRVDYVDVTMWELDPVEVRARTPPPANGQGVPAPEAAVFADEQVSIPEFRQRLADNGLALVVSRDVTTRDAADEQQPYNLRVPGGVQTTGAGGRIYDVEYQQFFQGDLLRGIGGASDPSPGRRVLAQVMHDPAVRNPPLDPGDPPGSAEVAVDGSVAAFVPAHRAMTWQLTAANGTPVVRERYWLTFRAGEVRVCASCHGLNSTDQAGASEPTNEPEALRSLLQWWKANEIFCSGFELGTTAAWSLVDP
jgi:hypothetical protein